MLEKNCPIEVFAAELRRRIQEGSGDAQKNLQTLSSIDRLILHNSIFPQTGYLLSGFTGFNNGSIYPILQQDFIPNERESTPIEIDMYMAALGFQKISEAKFSNGIVEFSDLHPRNVLRDSEGDLYVIDAEFRLVGEHDER